MIHSILVLMRTQLLITRNTFWRGKLRQKIWPVIFIVGLGFAAFGLYSLTRVIVAGITSPAFARFLARAARETPNLSTDFSTAVLPYLLALPSLVLFFALVLMVLTSFTTVLSSLYLSGDIDMLLAAPVPMRAVFVVKFFSGLVVPYLLMFFLLGPMLLGYGQGLYFGPAFFITAIAVLTLLPLLPTGIGALLVMAVVRVIPARRAREIVGVLGGMVGVSWYIFSQFANQITPSVNNARLLDVMLRFDNPVLPSAWAGRALVAAGLDHWGTLALYGGLFAVLSLGVFGVCIALAERLYYAGWSNISTQGGRIKKRHSATTSERTRTPTFAFVSALLPEQSRALLGKDIRIFPRDLRNVQQLIFPIVLVGIWSFRLLTNGSTTNDQPDDVFKALTTLTSAGISFYICIALSRAIGGAGISREGRGLWLLKVAPISAWRILLGKLALAYLPFPTVGMLFIIVLSILQHSTLATFVRAIILVVLGGLAISSISVGIGAAFPKLDWENPNQQSTISAALVALICYIIYVAIALAAVLGLPALATFVPNLALVLNIAGWFIFVALTVGVIYSTLVFGAGRLERLELT